MLCLTSYALLVQKNAILHQLALLPLSPCFPLPAPPSPFCCTSHSICVISDESSQGNYPGEDWVEAYKSCQLDNFLNLVYQIATQMPVWENRQRWEYRCSLIQNKSTLGSTKLIKNMAKHIGKSKQLYKPPYLFLNFSFCLFTLGSETLRLISIMLQRQMV